ncbi:MAG: tol-pal system protein YbgF [Gammaproteobacteria bacterium]|nr:MAG: tol-pal system protein YbgF [Gammaproteobacteria bacterium]
MNPKHAAGLVLLLGLGWGLAGTAPAGQGDLEARVTKLEQRLDSGALIEMMNTLDALQREVRELRGEVEMQGHALEQLRKRQHDLYLDIDRRLQALEAARTLPTAPAATPANSTAAPAAGAPQAPGGTGGQGATPEAIRAAYEKALAILHDGRYAEAAQAFTDFLARYPRNPYSDNAQYWLGETWYVSRDYDRALAEFTKVVQDYPDSPKVPDALLKIGFVQYEKKQWDAARRTLEAVVGRYPGTTAARLAARRLDRMKREGH